MKERPFLNQLTATRALTQAGAQRWSNTRWASTTRSVHLLEQALRAVGAPYCQ